MPNSIDNIRKPAVANAFYPGNKVELQHIIAECLNQPNIQPDTAANLVKSANPPKAIIVPHAGYIYSGSIAASAYRLLDKYANVIKRVVLLGPSHRVALYGFATSSADYFSSPLGKIPIDIDFQQRLNSNALVQQLDAAHEFEHSLEVQLPFLQTILVDFKIVPIVVGDASTEHVSQLLNTLWGDEETLIIVSSDLSHYHEYNIANRMDEATSLAIETLDYQSLDGDHACGCIAIRGLLHACQQRSLKAEKLDLRNSGDTAGAKDRVVGYGAYAFR